MRVKLSIPAEVNSETRRGAKTFDTRDVDDCSAAAATDHGPRRGLHSRDQALEINIDLPVGSSIGHLEKWYRAGSPAFTGRIIALLRRAD